MCDENQPHQTVIFVWLLVQVYSQGSLPDMQHIWVIVSFENLIENTLGHPQSKGSREEERRKDKHACPRPSGPPKCIPEGAPRLLCTPHHHPLMAFTAALADPLS